MSPLYTLKQAAEILGCHMADIEDRIRNGEFRCGVLAAGWRGHPVPLNDAGKLKSGSLMQTVIKPGVSGWVGTFDGEETQIVESAVEDFWHLEITVVKEVLARRAAGASVEWLVPVDSHWHTVHPKTFPWDRFLFRLLDTPTVQVEDLCISSADLRLIDGPKNTAQKKSGRRRTSEVCEIIVSILKRMGMGDQLLSLPDGSKSKARGIAASEFWVTEDSFDNAWKQLRDHDTVKMKNNEIFAGDSK